jgi:anti-anti-sigma factor
MSDDESVRRHGAPVELLVVEGVPTIRGELDLLTVPDLDRWLHALDGDSLIEVDLSGVTFFDSSALRAFLGMRRHNPRLRIVHPSKAVQRVLEITETVDYLIHGRDVVW